MKTKAKSSKVLWIIVALAAIVCVGVAVALSVRSTNKATSEQLLVADRYLDELEYDKAIAAYEAVIAIDTKCVDAYLGLAQAYEAKGEPILAIDILALAFDKVDETDRARIEKRYEQLVNIYQEGAEDTPQTSAPDMGNGFGQNDSQSNGQKSNTDSNQVVGVSWDWNRYTLFDKPLSGWTEESLMNHIRSNYTLINKDDYGGESYSITSDGEVIGGIGMSHRESGTSGMTIKINDGLHIQIQWMSKSVTYEFFTFAESDFSDEGLGTGDIIGMFGMTSSEYVQSVSPELYRHMEAQGEMCQVFFEDGEVIRQAGNPENISIRTGSHNITLHLYGEEAGSKIESVRVYVAY